jgi:hypothetical protein
MYTLYYDESGSPDDTIAVVVAGFVASDEQWKEFERNWNDTLKQFGVSLFHMREFAHSRGEFARWKDHLKVESQKQERQYFLGQLVGHILLRARRSFAHSVLMRDYREVNKEYLLSDGGITPYALCGRTCVARSSIWAQKYGIPESALQHVFEDGSIGKGDLRERILRDKGIAPVFKKKSECVPLQAADLLAYEHLLGDRDIFQKRIDNFEQLRFPLRKLQSLLYEPLDWGTYQRKELEDFCKNAGIPRRSTLKTA